MNQKQNKGFTLIEVLIAITILGIIVIPLLHAFVTSANVNAKSKRIMDATTLAQNIMEEFKASSLEGMLEQFTVDDVDEEDGTYLLSQVNVASGSSNYDVSVLVSKNENGTNNLANINSMDQSNCGYYVQPEELEQQTAAEFQLRNMTYVYEALAQKDVDAFRKMLSRTIVVTMSKDAVDVTFKYEIPRGYTSEEDRTYSETVRIFDNAMRTEETQEELEAVYLYFYPLFSDGTDKIEINNAENLEADVFLIKMDAENPHGTLMPAKSPVISVFESSLDREEGVAKTHLRVCTNMTSEEYSLQQKAIRIADLGGGEDVVSLYDIEIEIYRHQEEEAKAFLPEYLIKTYTGSFLDGGEEIE